MCFNYVKKIFSKPLYIQIFSFVNQNFQVGLEFDFDFILTIRGQKVESGAKI